MDDPKLSFCQTCAIRHSSLCGALSSDEIHNLNKIAQRKSLRAGQTYALEGDTANSFANVTDGVAKLMHVASDGRSQIVGLLFPSDFIGQPRASENRQKVPHTIEAVTDLELCLFPRAQFEDVLEAFPHLERTLLGRTMDELQIAREWMVLLGRKTAEERVASFLLHVKTKMENAVCKGTEGFELPMGRVDIADYLGLTYETVSRQISRLKREGILEMEGGKKVIRVDEARLREIAQF